MVRVRVRNRVRDRARVGDRTRVRVYLRQPAWWKGRAPGESSESPTMTTWLVSRLAGRLASR